MTQAAPPAAAVQLIRGFAGPNLFCRRTALRLAVTLPAAARTPAPAAGARLEDALAAAGVSGAGASVDGASGDGASGDAASGAALVGRIAVALQRSIGHLVSFAAAQPGRDPAGRW
ncbi:MAG: hypothetical protein U1E53_22630 [Dongiaceae bacterium]